MDSMATALIRRLLLGLAWFVALPLVAQVPAPASYVVRGVVFDSVVRAPLVGAVVRVATRDLLGSPVSAVTDSSGRFRITGLPAGRFLLDFEHDALDAYGLDAPLREFVLDTDTLVTVDIGVPSGAVVRTLHCGSTAAAADEGMLAGFIRDASGEHEFAGAMVTVSWRALALDSGSFHAVVQRARATARADGAYRLCGLPVDAPLDLQVAAPAARVLAGQILVPNAGVARQDIRLADSALVRGAASLRGRAVHENGQPVATGRAVLTALAREVPVVNGAFVMTDLPPGTWALEVKAIGVEARTTLIDATEGPAGALVSATITLDDRRQQLDAVTVIGKPNRDAKVLDDIMRRQRSSFGTVFLPGSVWLENAEHPADVLRAARGFDFRSSREIYGRPVGRLGGTMCYAIAVYLNGAYFPGGFEDLDNAVAVRDVLAIEAYPDVLSAPVQWRINHTVVEAPSTIGKIPRKGAPQPICAVVAVWTKH